MISIEEASKLASEEIKNMSAEKLLALIQERKNSPLAQAIRELTDFSRGFSVPK